MMWTNRNLDVTLLWRCKKTLNCVIKYGCQRGRFLADTIMQDIYDDNITYTPLAFKQAAAAQKAFPGRGTPFNVLLFTDAVRVL